MVACATSPVLAQDEADPQSEPPAPPAVTAGARVFEPDYFAQFAPRNALEMVERIPGFTIEGGNDDGQRGLGQATQNVIVNGARFSSKSDSVRDQLSRIPASDVTRIEIIDGNTLDIPGLTGQVANVVYQSSGASGQFRYTAGFRPHNTEAQLYGGEVSLTGSSGALDYTVALSNTNDRFGADGPALITDGNDELLEEQFSKMSGAYDNPRLATNFSYAFGGGAIANLNLSYREDFLDIDRPEIGMPAGGPQRTRLAKEKRTGPEYEIGGDVEFALGPGRLKLIGLERFERDNFFFRLVDSFDDGSPDQGSYFTQVDATGERIGRFEYGWNMLDSDWQVAGETAFNRLDRRSALSVLDGSGAFVPVPFPGGTGGVTEDRYEGSLSVSKELSSTLSLQAIGAMEFSKLEQTGSDANSRSFRRPKGSLAGTWKPSDDLDVSLTLARRVRQLTFGDFLGSVQLDNDQQSGSNSDLVPYQTWNLELVANKRLGPWGSIKFSALQAWFEDFIDWVPTEDGGEARGNIGDGDRLQLQVDATINFDPVGFKGARLDFTAVERFMYFTDPFTGETRANSGDVEGWLEGNFRHDVPDTDYAWGASIFTNDQVPYYRRYEVGRFWEGPVFLGLFAEHKDLFGLTATARVNNVLGARNKFYRTVYAGTRPSDEIDFIEDRNRRIGPIVTFSLSGDF
ncbi:TonB-dependent receptor plug domain-containing protein [Qipengyuania sp. GH29]|nr:TonB-dependent receptor plug domain-containing protein [Qipengyuania sphaerica]